MKKNDLYLNGSIPFIEIFCFVLFLFLSCAGSPKNIENNKPEEKPSFETPEGYGWKYQDESGLRFLQPVNWTYKKQVKDGVIGIFLTGKKGGETTNKMTINIIRGQKNSKSYANEIHVNFLKNNEILETFKNKGNKFDIIRSIIKIKNDGYFIRLILQTSVNLKTNTVYIIIFETPEMNWQTSQHVFNTISDSLKFNDVY